jgi:serine O-acetyltransferase
MPLSTSQEVGAAAVFPALTQAGLAAPGTRDEVWRSIRESAQALCAREPLMRTRLDEQVLSPETPCDIVAVLLAARMATKALHEAPLRELMRETLMAHPAIVRRIEADLHAIVERDPACPGALHALLNLKGFHALQVHRIAHVL